MDPCETACQGLGLVSSRVKFGVQILEPPMEGILWTGQSKAAAKRPTVGGWRVLYSGRRLRRRLKMPAAAGDLGGTVNVGADPRFWRQPTPAGPHRTHRRIGP